MRQLAFCEFQREGDERHVDQNANHSDRDGRAAYGPGPPLAGQIRAGAWGVTLPVTLAFSVLLGIWLMFAPAVLGGTGMAANSGRVVGALIVTVAAISTAEVVRAFRLLNVLFAVWLLAFSGS